MSGHSKWSTIKRKKEATDMVRGKTFSKISRLISVAVKTGGGPDPDTNHKLRMAIDAARAVNMPKSNIDKILSKAESTEKYEEVVYEGFGPSGIAVMVEATTDNRNRTAQEIKSLFERGGGQLAGPGAVSYNFKSKGMLLIKKESNPEEQMLKMIDMGVEELEESDEGIEAYVKPDLLGRVRENLKKEGFNIIKTELIQKPINLKIITQEDMARKALSFLNMLDEHDDVQNIYTNVNIVDDILDNIAS